MYVAPQVEMVNVAVEKGFAASGEHKTEFTGGDVEDMDL